MAKERLARQPEQDGGILADAPEHGGTVELVERLAEDVHALAFELIKMVHAGPGFLPHIHYHEHDEVSKGFVPAASKTTLLSGLHFLRSEA